MANAATYTVINNFDNGAGSLRQTILDANANPGLDSIDFNIPGSCHHTIKPMTGLPDITSPVDINGYTQSGAAVATGSSAATLCVEISGELILAPFGASGLVLRTGSSGSSIRGLVINRFRRSTVTNFGGEAINISNTPPLSGSHWIAGNYLNIDTAGTATFLSSGFPSVRHGIGDGGSGGNTIGHDPLGPNSSNPAADRNIISGAGTAPAAAGGGRPGILVFGASAGNKIRGNYVGTDVTGTLGLGNSNIGINISTPNNTFEDNLISGNTGVGLFISGAGNNSLVRGNKIGTDVTGTLALGNTLSGIRLDTANNTVEDNLLSANTTGFLSTAGGSNSIKDNKIGTDVTGTLPLGNIVRGVQLLTSNNTVAGNVVAFNVGAGVLVAPFPTGTPSLSNSILSNSIFGNNGLGIDLIAVLPCVLVCPDSGNPLLNDPLDADAGFANNLQNFPVIDGKRSFLNPALVQVWGSLDSKANQEYLIQVFSNDLADPSGYGEGKALVGEMMVTTDASGHADFHLPAMLGVPAGSIITATATDLLTMDTSEFSKWENLDSKGSPTAYENAAGAAGGDGMGSMDWEELAAELPPLEEPAE